ncbi:MAG: L-glutamate gamma-semialdehyde dehydrogenase [Chloroflexi bacterium]|nr:L-glutamate gamma-semialdehyde dehydrogenase [Chloroflexota bacterium]
MHEPFRNEPFTDFSLAENVSAFRAALEKVQAQCGGTFPHVIQGEEEHSDQHFPSVNPADPQEIVGHFSDGDASVADRAIDAASTAFEEWQYTPVAERAEYLFQAAAEMRRRKHEFSATMVLEVGKNWAEADGDTAEAIDFLEYYARQMLRIADSSDQLVEYEGENNSLYYIPLGVGAVIPPWNFPNAIACGMTAAALVAGNTVVIKPAEQSPWIAYKICELFWQQGLPAGVLNYITGPGEVVGARMVEHPETRFVVFTGSREVGTEIYAKTANVEEGQRWLKRAILEMGGKDAILVDETADLAAAAEGIVTSAFGFQGQKCSACSRAIIVEQVYDEVQRLVLEKSQGLLVGAPEKGNEITVGPVVDRDALRKISGYLEIGRSEGELLLGGNAADADEEGYFVEPTIFGRVDGNARIAQEEIFGPVLALVPTKDFDEGLKIVNSTEYGLTGALYSQDPARLERARREFHVGNLYFNRKCTGALVGLQPFGGFNMSGTDSKAGGPDYLLLFTQAKSIAERLPA